MSVDKEVALALDVSINSTSNNRSHVIVMGVRGLPRLTDVSINSTSNNRSHHIHSTQVRLSANKFPLIPLPIIEAIQNMVPNSREEIIWCFH